MSWKRLLLFACSAAFAVAGGVWYLAPMAKTSPVPALASSLPGSPPPARLPGPPDAPVIEITPDHELARVRHKGADGLSPLEIVSTPQGPVTIQRTFKADGTLLREVAFLDGQPVPVPVSGR